MLTFKLLKLLVLVGKMKEIGVTLTPYTCIWKVLGLNLSWDTGSAH